MTPSLENLRCFAAAADTRNFRRAARAVALTPAAFGHRIKQLEDQLGVVLFARTTRSVTLTEAGVALVGSARRCLQAAEECVRAARGEVGPAPMELTVGTRQELGLSWLLPQFDGLIRGRPFLRLHLYFGSGPDLVLRVHTREIDCAITSSRVLDPKLDALRLHKEDYVFVGAADLLSRVPFRRPEHAARHTLLDITPDLALFRYWKDAAQGSERMRFADAGYLGSIEAIRQRVLAGAGVAVLPEYHVRKDLARKKLRRILPAVEPLHDYFRLVFRADDPRRALFEAIAESLRHAPLR
jgi:DNA-binding transcriptional LysR family regulator